MERVQQRSAGPDLRGRDLSECDLASERLSGADLREATLTDARFDASTRWPAGFEPEAAGAQGA